MNQTPLYQEHLNLKAKMVEFGGWMMPVQYQGILSEYDATRNSVAIFDTAHMGEFLIEGDPIVTGLDRIVSCNIVDMPLKSCRYGFALNESGGIIDDLIVYRKAHHSWMIVVNAGTMKGDEEHFKKHLTNPQFFNNVSSQTGKLDIQGPRSREVLLKFFKEIERLAYYTFDVFDLWGEEVILSRTGYTGELGYEIYCSSSMLIRCWKEILKNPLVKPAGLGARDLLRIEMGYSLYGHEIDQTITPLEAGLEKFVDFNKDFLGKAALVKQKEAGVKRKSIAFVSLTRRAPRQHFRIFSGQGLDIGEVTSGTFSPDLGVGIGLGLVESTQGAIQQTIFIGENQNRFEAKVVRRPFYKKGSVKA